ncbi:MAG: isopentenyl phosphate kinase family protein [Anaerolineales bacterium]|nr:isopentenyl phosphate kinase family protein [Anaerolineales bacterium]MCK6581841.1 isopentenyl phosphate kinase family protein [Anaerolineales bacterium]GJQ36097.1 MAG: uridylate kinase [Anaerolineaceae bacterium]
MTNELILLKLGGSLITDKDKDYTPRLDKLKELSLEIKAAQDSAPGLSLILGHGSGSFGHVAAKKHGTRNGVHTKEQWLGFAEVRYQAAELNRYVLQSLLEAGIPALPFPPSASMISDGRKVIHHNVETIRRALKAGLLPVVQGDVAFDDSLGGTILSTEDVFAFLVAEFSASRILLAGLEAGVWEDFPARTRLVKQIRLADYEAMRGGIQGSASTDVTGGMKAKVEEMFALIQKHKGLTAQIFAAEEPGQLTRALRGENVGTLLSS